MPIVQIYANIQSQSESVSSLIENVRNLGSQALACDPSNIWVIVHPVPMGYGIGSKPKNVFSPLVFIQANRGRSLEIKENFVRGIEQALADFFSIPTKDIWIHYHEMNPQDIWHQGQWAPS